MSSVAHFPSKAVEARDERRAAVTIFVASRAAVWLVGGMLVWLLRPHAPGDAMWHERWLHDVGRYVDLWGRWDGAWYVRIAAQGYHTDAHATAFHPLYPLLVAGLGRVFDGHYLVAGICLSLTCGAAAFVLLRELAARLFGDEVAQRTLLYLALFPASLFLGAVYTESLFLLLAVAVFLLAERGRILEASAVTGLALLTRPTGVTLLPPLVLYAWRRRRLAATLVAPLLFAAYPLYQWLALGSPTRFLSAERAWDRSLSPLGLYDAVRVPLHDLATGARTDALLNLEGLAYLAVFVALVVLAWRVLDRPYGLFAGAALVLPLVEPGARWPLMSLPRFMVVVFPLFLALGVAIRDRRWQKAILALSALLLLASVARWTLYHWVA
jgi:hypothetical protein